MKLIRNIFSITLLLAFLSNTIGIQVYKHYCGDYLAAISLFHESSCGDQEEEESCKMQSEKNCCEDDFQFFKVDTDLANQSTQKLSQEKQFLNAVLAYHLFKLELSSDEFVVFNYEPPPEQHKVPIYKRLMRLTYYG